jgi:hypothetical protein
MLTPLLKPASAEGTFDLVVLEKEKVIAKIEAVANQRDQKTMSSDLAAFVAAYYFCTFPARATSSLRQFLTLS